MDTFKSQVEKYNETFLHPMLLRSKTKTHHRAKPSDVRDAKNLTEALKGDKQKQGAWGEMVLERILR